jgi:Zn-dependent alcohol dehydrogenase
MKTRSAVLREMGAPRPYADSRPLEVIELELDSEPGRGEILVKVGAAGLCHSDLSVIDGSRPRVMPMALGHEAAGEVVAVGEGVTDLAEGDHVVLAFVPACGSCDPCRAGRAALCMPGALANTQGTLLSGEIRLHDADGQPIHHHLGVSAFSEHIVVSERSAVKVDPRLSWEVAALFGCAVLTGVGAAVKSAGIRPGDSVAIFGLGGVGLAALMGAVLAGAGTIIGIDTIPEKLELARSLGATETLAAGPDVVEKVREATEGGADKTIETVGNAAVLAQAYAATGRGGSTVTVGLPDPSQELRIPAVSLVADERTLKGSYLGSCVPALDIPTFVALHLGDRLPVDRLLTGTLTLEEVNEGFDRLASGEAARQAILFD